MTDLVYDPYAYEMHEDPYPTYARLREEAPVYRNEEMGFWALSRYNDVMSAFRDSTRFSSADGVSIDPAASGPNAHKAMSFLAMDDPRHGALRALVSRAFTPRRVADLEPRIRSLADLYLTRALDHDRFDFVEDFAGKLPMDVISELIGVDPAERNEVSRLAGLLVHREAGVMDVPPAGVEAALTLIGFYSDLIRARRRRPADDLTSALLEAEIDGVRLNDDDIISFLFLMIVAGNETTTKLLSNAWYWGWRYPDEGAKPFTDASRLTDWVEETLRYDTSTQMLARTATQPVELHDVRIAAGDRVLLLVGAANRDPELFPEADRYDLDRDTTAVASFGFGRHYCLGASLARLETMVAMKELTARVSSYDIDTAEIRRVHSINVRGFAALPTTVTAR